MARRRALDLGPEDLLFGILVSGVRQGGLVQDAKSGEPFGEFCCGLGGAVVGEQGSRQAAFLKGLGESMDKGLGALGKIPLDMAGKARAVIEDAKQMSALPAPLGGEHTT